MSRARSPSSMCRLHLRDDVHFCASGDERIFLDLRTDRYFRLPPAADRAFAALARGCEEPSAGLDALRTAKLLVAPPEGRRAAATVHPSPTRSLVEEDRDVRLRWAVLPEVLILVLKARRAVLQKQLPRLIGQRRTAAFPPHNAQRDPLDALVEAFLQARRIAPVAPNCLYDSLALRQFLLRRSVHVDLVIGVKLHPFGAHCWLQDGTRVLNDTLASARDFTPILVA